MCGRYTLATQLPELEERFAFRASDFAYLPRYNVAPAQQVLALEANGERRPVLLRWGLIPSWAKDPSIGNRMINARAESVAERPAFRRALLKGRCLVLADGFYEWARRGGKKVPTHVALKSHEPFAFAGLAETWRSPEGALVRSCAIITTAANALMSDIHDRMPVILERDAEDLWLDPELDDPLLLTALLQPYPPEEMEAHPVSSLVNSPRNDTPECIAPVA